MALRTSRHSLDACRAAAAAATSGGRWPTVRRPSAGRVAWAPQPAGAAKDWARLQVVLGAAAGVVAGILADRGRHGFGAAPGAFLGLETRVEVQKPETHRHRSYEYLRLPNGLQVIIASDPACDKAAAALCVGVGKLHEPKDMPGLAHFCEHMLFLGTEAFPNEGEYKRFVKRHGGKCNAATGDSYTCYVFDVGPKHLGGALDRFSQFFRSPLLTPSATEREISAVDSEHSMRITDDGRRSYATLLLDANPRHPWHWGSGNAESLRDAPRELGKDPHEEVVKFYKEHYSADDMTLAVLGRQPLPELRQMVHDRFMEVRRTGRRALRGDSHGGDESAVKLEDFAGLVLRVPSKDMRKVAFAWQLPAWQVPLWESKPGAYASHVIGHEGEGSLLSALKAQGYATALSAGVDDFGCFSHFEISITLTKKGLEHIEEVGEFVFSYLRLLRAGEVQPWILDEMQQLREVKFRFADDRQPYALVNLLARNLQKYPPRSVLAAPLKLPRPDPGAAADVLQLLTVDGVRVELAAKVLADECTETDPWYGGQYARLPLKDTWRITWSEAAGFPEAVAGGGPAIEGMVAEAVAAKRGMRLPRANPFLPQDLSLRERTTDGVVPARPLRLETPVPGITKVFYRQDDRFGQPKVVAAFRIHSPAAAADAASYIRCQVWCSSIMEELNEFAYDARAAGLSYRLGSVSGGLELSVAGFHDRLPLLLERITKKMRESSSVAPATFAVVRDRYERGLKNRSRKQRPCDFAARKTKELLHSSKFTTEELLGELRKLKASDLDGENARLLDECRIEALLTGNIAAQDAASIAAVAGAQLRAPDKPRAAPRKAAAALPAGTTVWRIRGTNEEERNNAVRLEMQLPANLDTYVYTTLLVRILNPRFFEALRTKQQLGYIVQMSSSVHEGLRSVICTVQTEYPPEYVRARIEAFLDEHLAWLGSSLDEAEFARQRAGLASNLAERPKNLAEEFGRLWGEVASGRYDFERRDRKRRAVEAAELAAFQAFVRDHVRGAPRLYAEVHSIAPGAGKPPPAAAGTEGEPPLPDRVWATPEDAARFRAEARWVAKGGKELPAPARSRL